jgi:hypothetical protein
MPQPTSSREADSEGIGWKTGQGGTTAVDQYYLDTKENARRQVPDGRRAVRRAITEQRVEPVNHTFSERMVGAGRDIEALVLARALESISV